MTTAYPPLAGTAAPAGPAAGSADLTGMAKGGIVNTLGAVAAAVSGVGVVLVVTRALPPADAGVFFSLVSLTLITATVARLGTPTGLVYFLSIARARGHRGQERRLLRMALGPVVVLAVVSAAALAATADGVLDLLDINHLGGASDTQLRVFALFIPLAAVADVVLAGTRGLGVMRPTVVVDRIGRSSLQLVLVAAVAIATGSVVLTALAWSLPYLLSAVLAWRQFEAKTSSGTAPVDREPSAGHVTRTAFWRFTAPRSVSSVVQIALQRLDILLVAGYIGLVQAAIYTAASRFTVLGQLGAQAVSLAAQPRLGAALAHDDTRSANELYRTATGWLILTSWPIYLLSMVFAHQLLSLFGEGYDAGRSVVLVLGGVMLFATACGMVDMVLSMAGRTSWSLGNHLLALALNVGVDIVLIPRIGIIGAAIGWAVAIVATNLLPLCQVGLVLRIHPFGRNIAVAVVLSTVAFGALPLLGSAVAPHHVWGAVAGTVVGTVLFVAGCYRERHVLALGTLRDAVRPTRKPRKETV